MNRPITKNLLFRKQPFDSSKLSKLIEDGYLTMVRPDDHYQKVSFSPSKLGYGSGNCPRYWYIAFSGAEFKETTDALGVANMSNGTLAHERIQEVFEKSGILLEKEIEVQMSDPPIRGFVDLKVNLDDQVLVGEIKTTRQEAFAIRQSSMKPSPNHLLQLLIYMRALSLDLGFLMYENKNTNEFVIIPVEMSKTNSNFLDNALEWMRRVHAAYKEDTIPARVFTKKSLSCKQCPVFETCWSNEKSEVSIEALEVK